MEDVGTLLYQSPEILTNNNVRKITNGHDSRTDVWSFGCILIQICELDFPFNANSELRLI